jgi:threonine dehydrogenase-like Zn-dependent dehydrogenase
MYKYIIEEPGKICAKKEPAPVFDGDGVMVEVCMLSLCGSDYKLFQGTYGGFSDYPVTFGHEWAGKVVAVGSNCKVLAPGDTVTGDCSCWGVDESCVSCSIDRNICCNVEKYGITVEGFSTEYRMVPEHHLYKVPKGIPLKLAALTECFAVALNGVKRMKAALQPISKCRWNNVAEGRKCLIVGGGALGVATWLLLRNNPEWSNIEILEVNPARTEHLRQLYPDIPIRSIGEDGWYRAQSYKEMHGEYDAVVECAGNSRAWNIALASVVSGGVIVNLGLAHSGIVDLRLITLKRLTVAGSIGGTGSFPEVIEFLGKRSVDILKIVTHSFGNGIEDIRQAFDSFSDKTLKVQISLNSRTR